MPCPRETEESQLPMTLTKDAQARYVSFWVDDTEYRCAVLDDGSIVYVEIVNTEGSSTGVDPSFFDPDFLARGLAVARPTDPGLGSE